MAVTGRRRGESSASTVPESMDVVRDQEGDQVDAVEEEEKDSEPMRYPTKLHGRGGFSHARGTGRGRGRGLSIATYPAKPASATDTSPSDPMESLASSMSALQFIPHSVLVARGRGSGRGRGRGT